MVFMDKYSVPARTTSATALLLSKGRTIRCPAVNANPLLTTSAAALKSTWTIRGRLFGRQKDCTRAAPNAATTTCEKLKKAMPMRRNAKLGEIVLVIPGMRTFSVEAKSVKQSNAANCGRLAEDHHLAASSVIPIPDATTSAMYHFATLDIVLPSVKDSAAIFAILLIQVPIVSIAEGLYYRIS